MKPLPPDVESRYRELADRGEKLKTSARTSSTWVLLSDRALYLGDPLERYARRDITGIEFDRAGSGPGAMFFMSGSDVLARIDFEGPDRALLIPIEKALAPRRKLVRLLLDQEDYAPGETVRGHVEVEWPKASPVRGIRVGLVGTEETEIQISRGSGKNQSTTTYSEVDTQIAEEWILFGGERIGWLQAAKEALTSLFRRQGYEVLSAGRHRFPFKIVLPETALPSYEGTHATVKYRLYAVVDVPLGFDRLFEGVLTVVDPRERTVVPRTYEDERRAKGLLRKLSADLRMGFKITKAPYRFGETLQIRLRVENQSKKRIRSASFQLSAVEVARAQGYERETTSDVNTLVLKFPDPASENHDYQLNLPVPAWPIPYLGRHSRVDLWLSATLDVALGFNATISVPIEIE